MSVVLASPAAAAAGPASLAEAPASKGPPLEALPATDSGTAFTPSVPADPRTALRELILDYEQQSVGLNAKLVRSIESVAEVEDDLADVKSRLTHNTQQIVDLEKEKGEHLAALNTGMLVEKSLVSSEMQKLMDRVLEETQQRGKAESDKNKIEAELDELSAKLFSDANRLVAAERLARSIAENKSEQLEQSLKNTELVMAEQQKVLASLQQQFEELQSNPDLEPEPEPEPEPQPLSESEIVTANTALAPAGMLDCTNLPRPLLLRHLQLNVEAFREFTAFIAFLRRQRLELQPYYDYNPSRPAPAVSTNFSRPGMMGPMITGGHINPFLEAGVGRHKLYPSLPANADGLVVVSNQLSQPFLKRLEEEDAGPCLRLDLAPGLGWLNRRTAHTAIIDGTLVIEPVFPDGETLDPDEVRARTAHLAPAECAMCGMAVVNVPLGGLEPSFTTPRGRKTSAGWTSSFSGSANSLLSSAGIRNPKPVHATIQDDDLDEATGSAPTSPPATTPKLAPPSASPSTPNESLTSAHVPTEPDQGAKPPPTPTSSTTGPRRILGNFRFGTSSPTPTRTHTPSSSGLSLSRLSSNKSPGLPPKEEVTARSYHFPLPIPTHVFRLSEESPTRYLLCPHHASRLRAVCSFWEFVRKLEREIVLEGNNPWDADQLSTNDTQATSETIHASPANSAPYDKADDAPADMDNHRPGKGDTAHSSEGDATLPEAPTVGSPTTRGVTAGAMDAGVEPGASTAPNAASSVGAYAEQSAGVSEDKSSIQSDSALPGTGLATSPPPQKLLPRRPARRHPVADTDARSGSSTPSDTFASAADNDLAGAAAREAGPAGPAVVDAAATAEAAQTGAGSDKAEVKPKAKVARRDMIRVAGGDDLTWEERMWQHVVQHKATMTLARLGFAAYTNLAPTEGSEPSTC